MSKNTMGLTVINTPDGTVPETNPMSFMISTIVEGKDGNLYIKNPFTFYHTNSWVKAEHAEGDRYVIHTPQPIYQQGSSTFYLGKICLKDMKSLEDDLYADPDADDQDIVLTYKDGVLSQPTEKITSFDEYGNSVYIDVSPILALVTPNYAKKGYAPAGPAMATTTWC